MDEISEVKRSFDSHQIPLSLVWLESCINWCKEEILNSGYTFLELKYKIYEQWLLLDLRDVQIPSLPPNLGNQTKFVLNGNYSLQLMQVVDISKPKLWQIQKIRNTNALTRNTEPANPEVESGKRMLLMTLTDGVQEVEAMEYKTISSININMRPGIKVRLIGPITVRRGRLMLENSNIKILGGEVEEIIVSNAAENVLARALNLPENNTPFVIEESMSTANTDIFQNVQENKSNQNIVNSNRNSVNANKKQTAQVLNIDEDEERRIAEEMEILLEAEREMELANSNKRKSKTPDMFDDMDDTDFENINEADVINKHTKIISTTNETSLSKKPNTFEDSLEFNDDIFNSMIDEHLDFVENDLQNSNAIINITDLKNKKLSNATVRVKAKFKSIVKKLTVTEDQLQIVITIVDNTDDLTVSIDSDVIAGFAGYSTTEFLGLKKDVVKKDENATSKAIKALKDIKEKLIKLDNVLDLHIKENDMPKIMKLS